VFTHRLVPVAIPVNARGVTQTQPVPVRVFRSLDTLTVAAPMAGLGVEDIAVEVTDDGRVVLDGRLCGSPKLHCGELDSNKDVLLDEWAIGPYHREIRVGLPLDGPAATVTFGNGVLVVALPIADTTRPARLTLEPIGPARGERRAPSSAG
jgi:HSP20 family molecular chaperone IbpA